MKSRLTPPPFSHEGNVVVDAILLVLLAAFGKVNRDAAYRSGGWDMPISARRQPSSKVQA